MKMVSLRTRIILSFSLVILALGLFIALHRIYVIKNNIFNRAQKEVINDLKIARFIYQGEIELIEKVFSVIDSKIEFNKLKENLNLDYIYFTTSQDNIESEIVKKVFITKRGAGATRIIKAEELKKMNPLLYKKNKIQVRNTNKARPTSKKNIDSVLAIEYAMPLSNGVLYGGKIINNDFSLVDKIHNFIFENKLYDAKPIGTVTVFQDDVRVSTNVLDNSAKRAVGTRVSDTVYKKVVEEGKVWTDRAFVVTDWYLSAYEPIRDINGKIIGILYVGLLEKPFVDLERSVLFTLFMIVGLAIFLAVILSVVLSRSIVKPVVDMLKATRILSGGNLDYKIITETSIRELNELAYSFNDMAEKLSEREKSLEISNKKLAELNKSYLDLISFVAHELKGILSAAILNAYSLRDGFLGLINFKQRKAMDSVTRNLDYLDTTVKHFLNLSRIEKGELEIRKTNCLIKEDIFDPSVEAFLKLATEKNIQIINNIWPNLKIKADINLLLIVANNLISNALKYGKRDGQVVLNSRVLDKNLEIEVYNDGSPINQEDKQKIFKRFSRLNLTEAKNERGTGLGLFIVKEIIQKHFGNIELIVRQFGNSFIFLLPLEE
ncbi:MAG: cache domain-containing protein [Candidatus Omnitrophota bacterium]